jgi:hypothetical protein
VPLKAGDLQDKLENKFGFARDDSGKHITFKLVVDDVYLAATHVSHGWRAKDEIGDALVTLIARQLGVTSAQLRQMIACTLDSPGYRSLVGPAEN